MTDTWTLSLPVKSLAALRLATLVATTERAIARDPFVAMDPYDETERVDRILAVASCETCDDKGRIGEHVCMHDDSAEAPPAGQPKVSDSDGSAAGVGPSRQLREREELCESAPPVSDSRGAADSQYAVHSRDRILQEIAELTTSGRDPKTGTVVNSRAYAFELGFEDMYLSVLRRALRFVVLADYSCNDGVYADTAIEENCDDPLGERVVHTYQVMYLADVAVLTAIKNSIEEAGLQSVFNSRAAGAGWVDVAKSWGKSSDKNALAYFKKHAAGSDSRVFLQLKSEILHLRRIYADMVGYTSNIGAVRRGK